jgi:AcrR family transcriptional regulator
MKGISSMPKKGKEAREISGQTPKKLIDVSIDLFSRKGFKGTSIRDIAAEMGMTTSNIYHYFGTKAGLLSAIERQTLEPQIKEFRRISSLDLPPLDRFKLLLKTHLTFMDTNRNESKIFSLREEPFSHGKKDLNKRFQTETFFIYRSEIERLLASKGKKGNSTIAAFSTLGAVVWFLRWYNPEGPNSLEEVIKAIIDHVLFGIIGDRPKEGEA